MQDLRAPDMKRILLVDDDPLILRVFKDGLLRHGFQVETANDGLEALKLLQANKPDVVVLDLLMPKFNGADVVKFIRGHSEFADLPVIVLSNSYIDVLARAVQEAGVQEALLKSRCSPPALVEVIQKTLAQGVAGQSLAYDADENFKIKARHDFLRNGTQTCRSLRALSDALKSAPCDRDRVLRLQDYYRKTHFVSATAGLAGCSRIEQMCNVFEALLYVLMDKPVALTASVWRTINMVLDFLETLFQESEEFAASPRANTRVLVVDDDAVSVRVITSTLQRVNLMAYGFQNPIEAFLSLGSVQYHLILLDIEMPDVNGIEFCRRVRGLPRYRHSPIIFVTHHADFQTHAEGLLSGGNDLIAKPVFPMELAVKAVIHLLGKSEEA